MYCINKNRRDFKNLAKRHHISNDVLERIVYKYYDETGSQDKFPSDVYVDAQLGNLPYIEESAIMREGWSKRYKEPRIINNPHELDRVRTKAESLFPGHVVVYEDNEGNTVLRVQQPVEKIDIKHRKDFHSWQEYNDYLLVMGDLIPESQRDKEERKVGSQIFRFKDGTEVTAPFKPNNQQEEALNAISDFIDSDETSMTLSGYAGTGKTSLMEMIAQKLKKNRRKVVFSASTNKAAAVLRDRVEKAGYTAQTLNKVFGIQVEVDTTKPYDASNLVNKLKEADINPGTVVVIDEASMINEENYAILNGIAEDNGLKIIYVGDKGQLAPVNESQVSKVFRDKNGRVVTLTKVERTDDNAILKEATNIRNGKPLSGESEFNAQGKGVAYLRPTSKAAIKAIVERFVPELRKNPDFFRILAYTNNAVTKYNEAVRRALSYTDNTPRVGEPIVGYSNWGAEYDKRTRQTTYKFINSESYRVTKVDTPRTISYSLDGKKYQMVATPITIEDVMGNKQTINFIDIKGNAENRAAALSLAREKVRLFELAKRVPKREQPALYQLINDIEKFLFVNDYITENGRTLQSKVFDFGYAMTVHKSQGSTFTNVLVDDVDIAKAKDVRPSNTNMDEWMDVPIDFEEQSATNTLDTDVSSLETETSGGNLFAEMPKSALNASSINRAENNAANIRQQLEYVAVSRATDTVTIISNNVKTEDSPLNHTSKKESNNESSNPLTIQPEVFYTKQAVNDYVQALVDANIDKSTIKTEYTSATDTEDAYWTVSVNTPSTINQQNLRSNNNQDNENGNRETLLQRFSQEELRGCTGRIEEAEALLQRGSYSSTPEKSDQTSGVTFKENKPVIANEQVKILRDWAKEQGIWINNTSFYLKQQYGDEYTHGEEAHVYLSPDGTKVIKEIRLEYYVEPQLLLDRIVLHNAIDPETAMTLTHLGVDDEGNFVIIVEQPFVQGEYISQEEITDFMSSLGYKPNGRDETSYISEDNSIQINDLHEENVLKINGGYAIIDADFRLNTSNYGLGGTRTTTASIATVPEASPSGSTRYIPAPYQMPNLGIETGERVLQVNQEWKELALNELDSQLGEAVSEEEKAKIIRQIHQVVQATSQEDYESTPTEAQKEVNKKMTDYERRNKQLNALLDNTVGLTASEVRQTAEQVVNSISDIISEIQKNPEKATEYFPTFNASIDLSKATRKDIVKAVGINRLIALAKKRFEDLRWDESNPDAYAKYDDASILEQADLILDNWETIMELASDIFVANEGFGIKRNTKDGRYEANEQENIGYDYDDYADPQDEDAVREREDEQEHWQIETRTVDVMNSMSELVRMALHECYILDKNGSKILDKWGIPKRVDKKNAVSQILRWTQGALDINQMIDRLEAKRAKQPWLSQLLKRLRDITGQEADFQSQFYGVMNRPFQLYGIGQYEKGSYVSKPLNNHKVLTDIMKSLNAQFQLHELPLFTKRGINASNLSTLKKYHKELETLMSPYNIRSIGNTVSADKEFSQEDIEKASDILQGISRMLGYPITKEALQDIVSIENLHKMYHNARFIIEALEKQAQEEYKDYNPFDFNQKNGIRNAVQKFLAPIVEELEETAVSAFFEDGKMYQSYIIPSFLTHLFDQFEQQGEDFHNWMESFYGQSQWFKKNGRWRNPWLQIFAHRDNLGDRAREIFDHKVQLTFNKHSYMRNMSPEEYTISVFTEYFSSKTDTKSPEYTPTWFRVPIQSNKPSSEFIRFFADRSSNYKKNIVAQMFDFYLQELDRIDTVRKRNQREGEAVTINSFDENGRVFQFLTFLNSYLMDNGKIVDTNGGKLFRNTNGTVDTQKNNELRELLNKKINAETKLSADEESRLMSLVQEATALFMEERAKAILDNWERTGLLQAAEKVQGIKDYGRTVKENLENFIWNDFFAANNILQLTITDKAFYNGSDDMQKRLAELHAPGTKGNKYATDYNGQRVSDGFYRTVIISDLDGFVSNIIDNLAEVFNKMIEQAPADEKAGFEALKENLVGENGRYRKINVTDGQAYSSPSSYRKKAFMFGKWSQKAEEIYQNLKKGDYNLQDLETVFQPLKPFVYGHVQTNMGVENAPIQSMPVPFQAKNAEYLLVMADALMRGQNTGRPNLLSSVFRIMEESEELHPTQGIDTVQFESAIKSGGQGVINIAQFLTTPGGEEAAYTLIKNLIYKEGISDDGTSYNYDVFVKKTDYDNYALQQEVPAHFMEHEQAEPSQMRMNIPTDLDYTNYAGETNLYEWTDNNGTKHSVDAHEIRKEWEQVHADNIEASLIDLAKELKLDGSREERNLALSELLQDEIMSSPRYGIDLLQACQIDPKTGEFRIPKGDPIQSKRIEQLINSIIKSRVNKQKIAGGPVVQVSNFGTSRQLHIRFNDKQGNLLMLEEEWKAANPSTSADGYNQYLKDNQAGIAYFEVFAPVSMKTIFEKFKNPDGSINLEAVERCDPELLKMITGRIPNEDKYSNAHCKIVGFMPAVAGEAMMFPYELTEIDDSDFDVDKRYCQVKVMDIVTDWSKVRNNLFKTMMVSLNRMKANNPEAYSRWTKQKRWGQSDADVVREQLEMFLDNPEVMKDSDALMASVYQEYQRILKEEYPYTTKYPNQNTTDARNNQIIDMSWAIMSNEMTAPKILNPGGFEIPKKGAYVIAAYKAKNGTIPFEELNKMSIKELKKLINTNKDLAWIDSQIQYYKQNAAGSNLIGVFAVNKIAHAILEGNNLMIDIATFCGENPFTIADTTFEGLMILDPTKDSEGNYVGKNIGQGIGASADTSKDPWLDTIDVNMTTAGMFNAMLRLGIPWNDVALFMSQDVIISVLEEFNRKSLEGEKTTLDAIVNDKINRIKKNNGFTDDSTINTEPLTREELQQGLLPKAAVSGTLASERETIEYKTLLAFSKLRSLAKAVKKPTAITRLNSISSAVGPLIIDNIILEHKLKEFMSINNPDGTGFYSNGRPADTDVILEMHPILKQFSRTIDSRDGLCPARIMFFDMPAGSTHFISEILAKLPDSIKERIYDDRALLSKLSDFYQSYMLIASGLINPEQLKNYILGFPEYFIGKGNNKPMKEQYQDNAFIQAIQLNYDKKAGRAFLNIDTTGMMEQDKERLRMAWTDLHKADPVLSTRLFTYAFFRGGIGFSPKTWMSLVPSYVKEHLETTREGLKVTYLDTYRHFPTDRMVTDIVIEQFVRNNWDNNTLAPMKGGEGTNYEVDLSQGRLYVTDRNDVADLQGVRFMRTVENKETILWKLVGQESENTRNRFYVRVMPLGNNGEYVEMSTEANLQAIQKTTVIEQQEETDELPPVSPMEYDASQVETPDTQGQNLSQQAKNISSLIPMAMQAFSINELLATSLMAQYKEATQNNRVTKNQKSMMQRLFKEAGLNLSPEQAAEEFKKFC